MIERISTHQFMILSSAVLLGTVFLPIAQILAGVAGRDAWWSVLPGYLIAIPWGLMLLSFMRSYPGENLLQISEKLFGKWIGKVIGVCYTLISGYLTALFLSREGDTYERMLLPLVPRVVFTVGTLFLVIFLAWVGVEVLARFSEFVFPLVLGALVLTLVLSVPHFEWEEFYPVLAMGLKPVLLGILKTVAFPMEYIFFLAGVLPFLPTGEQARLKIGLWRAVIFVGVLLTLVTLTEIMVFGPEETTRLNLGILSLGKMIEIAKTVSGIESIFLGIWLGAAIIKITALFNITVWGLQYLFGFKKKLLFYLGVGLALFGITLFQSGGTKVYLELSATDNLLILPFALLWIPLVWLVERWRRRTHRA